MTTGSSLVTERLIIRLAQEADRPRFVSLFRDPQFRAFTQGPLSEPDAHRRFDRMLAMCAECAFAKQPLVEQASGRIVGYAGVDWFGAGDDRCLEFGWRLAAEARGLGYATEASRALLELAERTFTGEIFSMIANDNEASHNVARKLGFQPIGSVTIDGHAGRLYRIMIGEAC
jgi:RimJ/RimL family protein N-acetyltransferase